MSNNQSLNPFASLVKTYRRVFGKVATEYYESQTCEGKAPKA